MCALWFACNKDISKFDGLYSKGEIHQQTQTVVYLLPSLLYHVICNGRVSQSLNLCVCVCYFFHWVMRFAWMQWGNRESKLQTPKLCWKLPTASLNACGKRNERVASALRHLWAIWSTSSGCRRHLCITMAMMNRQQLLIGENWAFEVAVYFDSVQVSAPCKIFPPHHLRLFWYEVDGPYLVTFCCLRLGCA